MPTVPTYGGRQVSTRPIPNARLQSGPTPESEGAGVGEAMARFGDVAARIGTQLVDQVVRTERERADNLALTTAERQLNDLERLVLTDPEKGALSITGKDALNARAGAMESFDLQAAEIAKNLSSDRQRNVFTQLREDRRNRIIREIDRHGFEEYRKFEAGEAQASVKSAYDLAVANATNPERVAEALASIDRTIEVHGSAMGLTGPEQRKAFRDDIRSRVHEGVVLGLLAKDRDLDAQAYFEEIRDQIDGDRLPQLEEKLANGSRDILALRVSEEIWSRHGPSGDTDPVELDKMEADARARFANDPKTLKAVITYLRERKAGVDAGRADRADQTHGALWLAVSQGASLAQIRQLPEWQAASAKVRADVADRILARAEREASRAASAASRAAAEESRAYTRAQRLQQAKEDKGWAAYWDLARPEVLSTLTDAQLNAKRGELGDDHVNRLFEQRRRATGDPASVTIDADLFLQEAHRAGLPAYKDGKSEDEKARLGALEYAVKTTIAAEQAANGGKALSYERKGQITREVLRQKVMLDVSFRGDRSTSAAVVNPEEAAIAYVPIGEISPVHIREAVNYLRSINPGWQRLTDEQIRARAQRAIERAFAAKALGLGAEEEVRRLREAR